MREAQSPSECGSLMSSSDISLKFNLLSVQMALYGVHTVLHLSKELNTLAIKNYFCHATHTLSEQTLCGWTVFKV